MQRTYYVLSRNGESEDWSETTVKAYSPEVAIEAVAKEEGEYVAVLDRYFVRRKVGSVTKLTVLSERGQ